MEHKFCLPFHTHTKTNLHTHTQTLTHENTHTHIYIIHLLRAFQRIWIISLLKPQKRFQCQSKVPL